MENEKENNITLEKIQPDNPNYTNQNNNLKNNDNLHNLNQNNDITNKEFNNQSSEIVNAEVKTVETELTNTANNSIKEQQIQYNNIENNNNLHNLNNNLENTNNENNLIQNKENNNQYNENICHKCNSPLENYQQFCTKCGTQRGASNNKLCKKCGNVIDEDEKFCSKCGNKSHLDIQSDILNNKNKKKKIITFIIAGILIAISCTIFCTTILPVLTITTEQLLSEGRYEEAYKKAKKNNKDEVLKENVIAYVSYKASNALKDPSSFILRDAWYDDNTNYIALSSNGKNSYGASVPVYYHYYYDEDSNDYKLFAVLSSLTNETTSSWDTSSEKLEKLLNNIARSRIKKLMENDSLQLKKDSIDNINNLFEKDLLDNIRLLKENTNTSSNNSI